eukprot:COSAG03_NODE_11094_length_611_cov_1.285156_2_plen_87_part_01
MRFAVWSRPSRRASSRAEMCDGSSTGASSPLAAADELAQRQPLPIETVNAGNRPVFARPTSTPCGAKAARCGVGGSRSRALILLHNG